MIPSRSRFIFQICFQLTVGALLILCAVAAQAQSGRRSSKPPATPGVQPAADAKPPEKKPATSDLPKVKARITLPVWAESKIFAEGEFNGIHEFLLEHSLSAKGKGYEGTVKTNLAIAH